MNFESGQIGDLGSAANQFLQQMHGHLMHKLNIVPNDPCPDAHAMRYRRVLH
ncbi:MAG: hypothetical protein ACI9LY_001095 [Arenicella sp.]|jgi:hypothetical protein